MVHDNTFWHLLFIITVYKESSQWMAKREDNANDYLMTGRMCDFMLKSFCSPL